MKIVGFSAVSTNERFMRLLYLLYIWYFCNPHMQVLKKRLRNPLSLFIFEGGFITTY